MYAREAREKLTGDLAHLYQEGRFQKQPGVVVIGAGDPEVNGWYHRREHAEGPPKMWPSYLWGDKSRWAQMNVDKWYENDNGCFILPWIIYASNGFSLYARPVPADQDAATPP